jgi:hypothetical protein
MKATEEEEVEVYYTDTVPQLEQPVYCSVSTKGSWGVAHHLNCSLGPVFRGQPRLSLAWQLFILPSDCLD